MARKSQRLSGVSMSASTHKRTASATALPGETGRKKAQKATPTKSQYFNTNAADDSTPEEEDDERSSVPGDEDASDFVSESASDNNGEDEDNEDSYNDDEEAPKRRKKRATPRKTGSIPISVGGSEVWREGVKTGLGPGKEVIIKKAKARAAGRTPYAEGTLHPNTLLFLADLKSNNDREWLKSEYYLGLRMLPTLPGILPGKVGSIRRPK